MPPLSYSTSLVAFTPENVGDVQSMFNQVAGVVNALDNDNIALGAGIDYSKLSLGGSIVNADVKSDAAIAISKVNVGAGPVQRSGETLKLMPYYVQQGLDTNIDSGTWGTWGGINNMTFTDMPVGRYLLGAQVTLEAGDPSTLMESGIRILTGGGTVITSTRHRHENLNGPQTENCFAIWNNTAATTDLLVQCSSSGFAGVSVARVAYGNWFFALRIT